MVLHNIPPLYCEKSETLILGSFPSVKSREAEFFYGHPQNRFWRVLAGVFSAPVPETVEQKKKLVLENRLALWDVIAECEITGSADTSIKNVKPNDIAGIIGRKPNICKRQNGGKILYPLYRKNGGAKGNLPALNQPRKRGLVA